MIASILAAVVAGAFAADTVAHLAPPQSSRWAVIPHVCNHIGMLLQQLEQVHPLASLLPATATRAVAPPHTLTMRLHMFVIRLAKAIPGDTLATITIVVREQGADVSSSSSSNSSSLQSPRCILHMCIHTVYCWLICRCGCHHPPPHTTLQLIRKIALSVSDPTSPLYGEYLSQTELDDITRPAAADTGERTPTKKKHTHPTTIPRSPFHFRCFLAPTAFARTLEAVECGRLYLC